MEDAKLKPSKEIAQVLRNAGVLKSRKGGFVTRPLILQKGVVRITKK